MQYFKPLFGKALSVKGLYPPEATTPAADATTTTTEENAIEARSVKLTPATKVPKASTATSTEAATTEAPRIKRVTRAVAVLPEGTTDDTPDFNRDQVMLDIPDQLFGNSFTM